MVYDGPLNIEIQDLDEGVAPSTAQKDLALTEPQHSRVSAPSLNILDLSLPSLDQSLEQSLEASSPESLCDGLDDDSDDLIDEGVCPCPTYSRWGSLYLLCNGWIFDSTPSLAPNHWNGARSSCTSAGFTLVKIGSEGENSFLTDLLIENELSDSWIGLNDQAVEGEFQWANSGSSLYSNWAMGEPNNGGETGEQDCVSLLASESGSSLWDDRNCGNVKPFLCERSIDFDD